MYYLIFFAGGIPALVYQVVWQRALTLYFGVDIYSTSVTVATFMLGLGLGSLLGGWIADRTGRPMLAYAGAEVSMGVFGAVSLPLFAAVGTAFAGGSLAVVVAVDFALLLVPTTVMGMTLPLMCRIVVDRDDTIGRHLAWLYGVNTLGAALGALLSSYLLVGLFGMDGATRLAAALNVALAVLVWAAAARSRGRRPADALLRDDVVPGSAPAAWGSVLDYRWVLALSFASGFIALGYEMVWYRVLGILLHGTVYVFGTVLFFLLAGMAAGSVLARRHIDDANCVRRFAACQLGIAVYGMALFTAIGRLSGMFPLRQITAASFFTTFHPSPELVAGHVDVFSLYSLIDIALWSLLILGIPTVLMGYGFANLMREGTQRAATVGRSVSGVYMANIAGSTIGSLATGFVVVHYFGTERALLMLILGGCALPMLLPLAQREDAAGAHAVRRVLSRAAVPAAVMLLAILVFPGPTDVIKAIHFADQRGVEFVGAEDRSGVSVLRRQREVIAFGQEALILGQQRLYIDGSHHGDGTEAFEPDEAAAVALAAHPAPRRVLVIGLGDAGMAATAARSPEVEELVIVELNGTLDRIVTLTAAGRTLFESGKVRYVVDDGRRWLQANRDDRFDVIMMFPLHAAHAYSGSLYSLEFLGILSQHLGPGGILLVRTADMYSTARTVATVFPQVVRLDGSAYIASGRPIRLDSQRLPFTAAEAVHRLDADRDVILSATRGARLNRDFGPNSEFYVTYPFASALQTRFGNPIAYKASDGDHVRRLLARHEQEIE